MASKAELKALVDHLRCNTYFSESAPTQPPVPSRFPVAVADLAIITSDLSKCPISDLPRCPIEVRHQTCGGIVRFTPDHIDPINGIFWCQGYLAFDPERGCAPWCNCSWLARDIIKAPMSDLTKDFFTVLKEGDDETWPEKLVEVAEKTMRYMKTRPVTNVELLEMRARRMMEIRERKR